MKILLVSDKEEPYIWDNFDRERFKDIEMIISCGDLSADYLSFLVTMINAPLFYVPGNHNSDYIKNPPEGCTSIDNKLITYKNIRLLGLGGCRCYNNSEYQYTERQMKLRILKLKPGIWLKKGFDILVAHSPAYLLGDRSDLCHSGFASFNELLDRHAPKYFFHGHVHLNYGSKQRIIKYKDTTIINAYGYHILDY